MNFEALISHWLTALNLNFKVIAVVIFVIELALLILIAFISDLISKKVLLNSIKKLVAKSKSNWDDMLYDRHVFNKLAHIIPAIIVQYLTGLFYKEYPEFVYFVNKAISVFIIYISLRAVSAFIYGLHDIYVTLPVSKNKPIKSYVQIAVILIYFIGILLVYSIVFERPVDKFFTGITALAAVLMLVFKDTILGLVGGVQLSANDMVRPGDWIVMPSRKADGDVIDISLHTVKVQNWDKTITTIPTYALVNESFVNWRGMEQSGGRRIKRSINIDMTSVKFCDKQMIEKFKKIKILRPYIESKLEELENYNKENNIDESVMVNGRRITNLGTFRKYIELYLRNHPKVNKEMTFLIRHLQPGENGIPVEVYVFSNDKVWANYEAIQADIFDHILAVIPEFELSVFQNPSGNDFKSLTK